jgi:DNA-binding transcriptional ArsR family regulator
MPLAKLEVFPPRTVALSRFAKALAHPARIAVLTFLERHGEQPAMDIVDALPLSQPATSRHLKELKKAGLLKSRLKGSQVLYRLDATRIRQFCGAFNSTLHPH